MSQAVWENDLDRVSMALVAEHLTGEVVRSLEAAARGAGAGGSERRRRLREADGTRMRARRNQVGAVEEGLR